MAQNRITNNNLKNNENPEPDSDEKKLMEALKEKDLKNALMLASGHGHTEIVKLLVEKEAKDN